jgi:hypothetical protein
MKALKLRALGLIYSTERENTRGQRRFALADALWVAQ